MLLLSTVCFAPFFFPFLFLLSESRTRVAPLWGTNEFSHARRRCRCPTYGFRLTKQCPVVVTRVTGRPVFCAQQPAAVSDGTRYTIYHPASIAQQQPCHLSFSPFCCCCRCRRRYLNAISNPATSANKAKAPTIFILIPILMMMVVSLLWKRRPTDPTRFVPLTQRAWNFNERRERDTHQAVRRRNERGYCPSTTVQCNYRTAKGTCSDRLRAEKKGENTTTPKGEN